MPKQKHHYIPEFYLKKWCDPSGCLIEFCRRKTGPKTANVVPRRTAPGGTGYQIGLYSLAGGPPELMNIIEEKLMGDTDGKAAVLREVLLTGRAFNWNGEQRSSWSRFIMSLLQRNPEKVAWLGQHAMAWQGSLEEKRRDELVRRGLSDFTEIRATDPYLVSRLALNALEEIIDLKSVGDHINQMHWAVTTIPERAGSFLTSDRPVVMTDGIKYADSMIVLPISPKSIFHAVNDVAVQHQISELSPSLLVKYTNEAVVRQAKKYVFGEDSSQLRFIENRLGRYQPQFIGGYPPRG